MHDSARRFVAAIAPLITDSVCEIGSRNVNGSIRYLFSGRYVGVDALPGPGVDIVTDGATWDGDGQTFDAVVCCEVLEHAASVERLIQNMLRLCRPGGVILITAAGEGRAPHSAIDGGPLRDGEHYRGVSAEALRACFKGCRAVMIDDRTPGDIYCLAVK